MSARGFILGAPRSGSGKTTVSLALLAALRKRGVAVRAAKSGPDYIDPAFHEAACGRPSPNLDSWAMPPDLVDAIAATAAADSEILLIESSMGLFDGVGSIAGRRGAGADLAQRLNLPVILVVDVSGQSQSAAAVAGGFARHDPGVRVAGVILNRVASERHRSQVAEAMAAIDMPVVGVVPRDAKVAIPERHLGLVQAIEHGDLDGLLDRLAALAEAHLDIDAIVRLAAPIAGFAGDAPGLRPPGQRIALASDAAFTFVYAHLLASWRKAGAEIAKFSPLADQGPPAGCDACWLPGGYPELHAGQLAAAENFHRALTAFALQHPVHGECGGFMALGAGLEDAEGKRHAMLGLLGHATSFAKRKMNLGYREARLLADGVLGPAGAVIRGHEFHYASLIEPGSDAPLVELADARGQSLGSAGARRGNVSGAFFHAIAPT